MKIIKSLQGNCSKPNLYLTILKQITNFKQQKS